MVDIFARLEKNAGGPIGQYMSYAHGYFAFPKLEGEIGPHMVFRGKKMLNWSLNNYLGLANHPEVRKADAEGAAEFGMAAPMGARMMSGQTKYHERLERELAEFVGKEDAFLLNFGYQGMLSIIDCLLTPRDVVVYDAEAHACIIDGLRLHKGKRFVYGHNDMDSLRLQLKHATELAEEQNGGVLVITEGVFGMKGDLGKLDEIVALKKDFQFRLLVDDAHGFGTMGEGGRGTASHFGVVDGVDVLFNTFAKSMAGIGAFVSGPRWLINLLRYNMRSQLYAKSLPMPMVIGALKRLELIRNHPEYQQKLLGDRPRIAERSEGERVQYRCDEFARDPRFHEGRHSRGDEPDRRSAREPRRVLFDRRLSGDPEGRDHSARDSDGGPYARGRELYARGVQVGARQARKRLLCEPAHSGPRRRGIQGPLIRSRFRREPDSRINSRHLRPCGRGCLFFERHSGWVRSRFGTGLSAGPGDLRFPEDFVRNGFWVEAGPARRTAPFPGSLVRTGGRTGCSGPMAFAETVVWNRGRGPLRPVVRGWSSLPGCCPETAWK